MFYSTPRKQEKSTASRWGKGRLSKGLSKGVKGGSAAAPLEMIRSSLESGTTRTKTASWHALREIKPTPLETPHRKGGTGKSFPALPNPHVLALAAPQEIHWPRCEIVTPDLDLGGPCQCST